MVCLSLFNQIFHIYKYIHAFIVKDKWSRKEKDQDNDWKINCCGFHMQLSCTKHGRKKKARLNKGWLLRKKIFQLKIMRRMYGRLSSNTMPAYWILCQKVKSSRTSHAPKTHGAPCLYLISVPLNYWTKRESWWQQRLKKKKTRKKNKKKKKNSACKGEQWPETRDMCSSHKSASWWKWSIYKGISQRDLQVTTKKKFERFTRNVNKGPWNSESSFVFEYWY